MADKVTVMVLKVDLQCSTCYKKIKKLLCKAPEVRDQVFDEKQNQVTISVVSCCPDRIKAKLISKAGKVIKSIETPKPKSKEPEKPKTDDKPKAEAAKPKSDDKPKAEAAKPKSDDKPKVAGGDVPKPKSDEKPKGAETAKPKSDDKPKGADTAKPKSDEKPKEAEKPKSVEAAHAMIVDPHGYSVPFIVGPDPYVQYGYPVVSAGWGYGEPSYEGYARAPYHNEYGYGSRPVPPQTPYDYGRGYSYGQDNPSTCTIM